MKTFSSDFLLGAATAAHQVEGNNTHSDYWTMENLEGSSFVEPSLDACDHYNRYEEDIKLLKETGLNAYRFTIEWARIEPKEGDFDHAELEHYRKVLEFCHKVGVTPVVTLHHFSSPKWLIEKGGWEKEETIDYFRRYVSFVISRLGSLTPLVCTINEANMGVQIARIMKKYMAKMAALKKDNPDVQVGLNIQNQREKSISDIKLEEAFGIPVKEIQHFLMPRTQKGDEIILKCHLAARQAIRALDKTIKVGLTMSLYDYQALEGGESFVEELWQEDFLHYLPYMEEDDFIGIQNYTRKVFDKNGQIQPDSNTPMTGMGNEYYPRSLAGVLRYVSKVWKKDLLVTENGISTKNDEERVAFIQEALEGLYECLDEGIPVIGYLHWSLLDNFEWQKGYDQKFGLIEVDRQTQRRIPKESFKTLGNIGLYGLRD